MNTEGKYFVRWYIRLAKNQPTATGLSSYHDSESKAWWAAYDAIKQIMGCPSAHAPLAGLWYAIGEIKNGREVETMATNKIEDYLANGEEEA